MDPYVDANGSGGVRTLALSRRFGKVTAVEGLSCEAPAGSITAFLGANGAGKTTTLNVLTTLLAPSEGTAAVAGRDVVREGPAVRRLIGYVPEHGIVYEGLTADEYLELAARVHGLEEEEFLPRASRLLEWFEIGAERRNRLGTFSKGMRRKVLVVAALLHDPRVLLLDEPMDGLDVKSQKRLGDLLRDLAAEGRCVIYASHVLQQVEELCDRLVLLHRGRLLWQGPVAELRQSHGGRPLGEIFLQMTAEDGGVRRSWRDLCEGSGA